MKEAILYLQDGTSFRGRTLKETGETAGEAVFNTAMTGYQEVLTDPSYTGQIVVMTYPLIGNYGVNDEDVESDRVHEPDGGWRNATELRMHGAKPPANDSGDESAASRGQR